MKRFLTLNALTLCFLALFLAALAGESVAGWKEYDQTQLSNGLAQLGYLSYLTSSAFAVDVVENWQSEYLQFLLYIWVTVWLVQKGSTESKEPGQEGRESDQKQKVGRYAQDDSPPWAKAGGWRTMVYSRSLGLVMGAIFVGSWFAQGVAGRAAYNADQLANLADPVSLLSYMGSASFWNRTLQNWQSEFLAVASMSLFSIFLRQRGSPESKLVGSPHEATGVSG